MNFSQFNGSNREIPLFMHIMFELFLDQTCWKWRRIVEHFQMLKVQVPCHQNMVSLFWWFQSS